MKRLLLLAAIVVAGCSRPAGAGTPEAVAGCAPAEVPTFLDDSFVAFKDQRTHPIIPPTVGGSGVVVDSLDEASLVVSFPAIAAEVPSLGSPFIVAEAESPSLAMYFAKDPVQTGETLDAFLASGGVIVIERPASADISVSTIKEVVGDRATAILIGPYDGVVVHADPFGPSEQRSYIVSWDDGVRANRVEAVDPLLAIDIARSMACTGS